MQRRAWPEALSPARGGTPARTWRQHLVQGVGHRQRNPCGAPARRSGILPTLVTVGEFDEVGPELVRGHASRIPGARYELLAGAAHLTPWDAREANLRVVREFLRSADSVSVDPSR